MPASPIQARQNQWIFTPEEIASTPSVLHGITPAEESTRRAKGVNFIYQAGICLQPHPLPQLTLYVAAVFFHRFFMRYSLVVEKGGAHHYVGLGPTPPHWSMSANHAQNIAATAIFLANKTEENCFKTRNLIVACVRAAQKKKDLVIDEQSKEYWRWRDSILAHEELMLEILTFDLMVTNPYDQLWNHLQKLKMTHSKELRQAAWAFCNDTAMTSLPLLMDPSAIATAAVFFASIASKTKIDDVDEQAWWKFLGADEKHIISAVDIMDASYRDHPLRKTETRAGAGSPEFTLENTRRRADVPSQTEAGSSPGDTPRDLDPDMQSPLAHHPDGRADRDDAESQTQDDSPVEARTARGDSSAVLKVAANNLDVHDGRPNGSGLVSPVPKRKSQEPERHEEERLAKRAKTSEDDY